MIKIALIGCGRVAGHHLRSIRRVRGGEIVAVCDLLEDRAMTYGQEYDIPWFTNYHEMLSRIPEIDVVSIITPSGMHFEHGLDVMRRYHKHVLFEKPSFMRPEQLRESYQLADELSLQIFPVFQNRNNKAVQRVKHAVDSGELGNIRIIAVRVRWCRPQRYYELAPWRGTYSHDGGALTNQGIHHVDLLRYLGGEVASVNATMRTLGVDVEVEDTIVATVAYQSDAVGVLEITTAARPLDFEASLSIVGSKGLAQLGGWAVNELQEFTPDPQACIDFSEEIPDSYGFGHIAVYRSLVGSFQEREKFQIDRDDCLNTISLLHAFYRSDEVGDCVNVSPDVSSIRLGRLNEKISNLYRTPEPTNAS